MHMCVCVYRCIYVRLPPCKATPQWPERSPTTPCPYARFETDSVPVTGAHAAASALRKFNAAE